MLKNVLDRGKLLLGHSKSNHSSRLAWDIAVGPPQSLYDVTTLKRVGAIARKLGITWGGKWVGILIDRISRLNHLGNAYRL
ncbi:M15 family metallopeptidase [Lysinibacillus sphaericus]|uniref:M15 family metallopeptidase n=1 Tax=Lysinibacillus sphaericus TaxID=1421 RepID=UPI002107CBB6|nr:M15 family metallopeptidase [Lysinibacillus sp. SDF0037]